MKFTSRSAIRNLSLSLRISFADVFKLIFAINDGILFSFSNIQLIQTSTKSGLAVEWVFQKGVRQTKTNSPLKCFAETYQICKWFVQILWNIMLHMEHSSFCRAGCHISTFIDPNFDSKFSAEAVNNTGQYISYQDLSHFVTGTTLTNWNRFFAIVTEWTLELRLQSTLSLLSLKNWYFWSITRGQYELVLWFPN